MSECVAVVVSLCASLSYLFCAGNLRVNVLTGRVVFKNVHYYCRDYSFRLEQHTHTHTHTHKQTNYVQDMWSISRVAVISTELKCVLYIC